MVGRYAKQKENKNVDKMFLMLKKEKSGNQFQTWICGECASRSLPWSNNKKKTEKEKSVYNNSIEKTLTNMYNQHNSTMVQKTNKGTESCEQCQRREKQSKLKK